MIVRFSRFLKKIDLIEACVLLCVIAVFCIHLFYIVYEPYLDYDVAQTLTSAQKVIHGATLYEDIIELNPPMIIYLNCIPALISDLTHAPLAVCGLWFYFGVMLFSIMLLLAAMRYSFQSISRIYLYALLAFGLWVSIWTYQNNNFAQREQFIFLFISPIIFIRNARYQNKAIPGYLAILCAFFAFIGIGMKPFFIFPVIGVELIFMLTYKRILPNVFSIEILALIAFGFFYLLHLLIIPGINRYYFYWIPLVLKGYSVYNVGLNEAITRFLSVKYVYVWIAGFLLLCVLPFHKNYKKNVNFIIAVAFGGFALFSLMIYFMQRKGWFYHALPFVFSVFMGLFFTLMGFFTKNGIISKKSKKLLCLFIVFVVIMITPSLKLIHWEILKKKPLQLSYTPLVEIIELLTTPSDRVLFIDTSVPPAFPSLTYTGREFGGRFPCVMPIAFIFSDSKDYIVPEEWKNEENQFYEMLKEDVKLNRPKLIIIQDKKGPFGTPSYFQISEYLRRRGFYMEILNKYRMVGYSKTFEIFWFDDKTR